MGGQNGVGLNVPPRSAVGDAGRIPRPEEVSPVTTVESAGADVGQATAAWWRGLSRPTHQTCLVLAMVVVQVALAAVVGHALLGAGAADPALVLPWYALAIGFAATEAFVFHVQFQREAHTVSMSELPLVLALFFAPPLHLLAGRLIGSALILVFHRRSSPLKTTWNLAFVTLQTAVAVCLFHLVAGSAGGGDVRGWLGAYAGAIGANALGVVALAMVVGIYDGRLRPRALLTDLLKGDPFQPVVVTIGLVAVVCLDTSPRSVVLLLLTGAGLLVAYRAYAALSDRHLNLERLYRFTQAVSSSPEVGEVLGNVLEEAKELLRCETAEVAFVASTTGDVAHVRLGSTGRLTRAEEPQSSEDEWLFGTVVARGEPLLLARGTRDPDERRWLAAQAAREAVAVPLQGGAGIIGALVVTDRMGEVRAYDEEDLLLLETVANHASVALQNGELIDRLRHEAMHDTLTGLPNRAFLQRRLTAALDEVGDGRSPGAAVMILDLDGFKEVNDTLGHHQGDQLLIEVAARLQTAVDTAGIAARLGGDEFAVLLSGTGDEDKVIRVGRRILRALEQPIALDDMEVEVGGSLGIALAPAHATDPAVLLKRADLAMYDAKASTHGLRVYEPDLDTTNPRRLTLVSELRAGLSSGQLKVYAQPQARLLDGEVVSVEALARWDHPELGPVPPDEFIPIAERSGLINPLTTRMLDQSLRAVAEWRAAGYDLGIAVNL